MKLDLTQVPGLGSIGVLRPGDTLVLTSDIALTEVEWVEFQKRVGSVLPNSVKVIFLSNDLNGQILSVGLVVWVALRCWPLLQVLGAFATEQEAYDVCETMNDVIGPMEIGKPLTGDCDWVGAYHPLVKVGKDGGETTEANVGEDSGGESGKETAE